MGGAAPSSPLATTSTPTPSPMGTSPGSASSPTEAPSSSYGAGDAMCCFDAGCTSYGTSFCSAAGTWCSGSAEACESCGGTLCVESAGSGPVSATPPPAPVPVSVPTLSPVEPAPSPPSSGPTGGAQCCFSEGCSGFGNSASCHAAGLWCSESSEQCATCGGTLCTAAAEPAPSPPSSEPTGGAQCCFSGGCSGFGNPASCYAAGQWCSESSEQCTNCGGTLCSGPNAFIESQARRHKFLHKQVASGNILLQTDTSFEKALQPGRASCFEFE